MEKLGSVVRGVARSYLYSRAAKDAVRFIRRNMREMDFDRNRLLHKVGLQPYRASNNWLLLIVGAVAGAGCALALAPAPGRTLRNQVKERATALLQRTEERANEARSALS